MNQNYTNPHFRGWVYHVGAADLCAEAPNKLMGEGLEETLRREALDSPLVPHPSWNGLYARWERLGKPSNFNLPVKGPSTDPVPRENGCVQIPTGNLLSFTVEDVVIIVGVNNPYIVLNCSSPAVSLTVPCLGERERDLALVRRLGWSGTVTIIDRHNHSSTTIV